MGKAWKSITSVLDSSSKSGLKGGGAVEQGASSSTQSKVGGVEFIDYEDKNIYHAPCKSGCYKSISYNSGKEEEIAHPYELSSRQSSNYPKQYTCYQNGKDAIKPRQGAKQKFNKGIYVSPKQSELHGEVEFSCPGDSVLSGIMNENKSTHETGINRWYKDRLAYNPSYYHFICQFLEDAKGYPIRKSDCKWGVYDEESKLWKKNEYRPTFKENTDQTLISHRVEKEVSFSCDEGYVLSGQRSWELDGKQGKIFLPTIANNEQLAVMPSSYEKMSKKNSFSSGLNKVFPYAKAYRKDSNDHQIFPRVYQNHCCRLRSHKGTIAVNFEAPQFKITHTDVSKAIKKEMNDRQSQKLSTKETSYKRPTCNSSIGTVSTNIQPVGQMGSKTKYYSYSCSYVPKEKIPASFSLTPFVFNSFYRFPTLYLLKSNQTCYAINDLNNFIVKGIYEDNIEEIKKNLQCMPVSHAVLGGCFGSSCLDTSETASTQAKTPPGVQTRFIMQKNQLSIDSLQCCTLKLQKESTILSAP